MMCTEKYENRVSLSQKTVKKSLYITIFGQNVSNLAIRGSNIFTWILTKFDMHIWPMSKLMFTKFCQSRSRILSAMAFLEKKGMKKKLHFAIIDQKLYPIFNTSWNARNLEFCMSQIISRKMLTHKFDNFWCGSSSKKRVLQSS